MINLLIHMYMGLGMDHDERSGFDFLYAALQDRFAGPGTSVRRPGKWNWHADEDAAFDVRHLHWGANVIGIGFSYGGYNIIQYARAMQRHKVDVEYLFLLDAVWRGRLARYSWLARSASVITRAFNKKLVIPSNVNNVITWRQETAVPMGHRVRCESDRTNHMDIVLPKPITHGQVEEQASVHERIGNEIAEVIAA